MSALAAGYTRRGGGELPRQGDRAPWGVTNDLRAERRQLLHEPIDDGWLRFESAPCSDRVALAGA